MTYGGTGHAKEYQFERYLHESLVHHIAPVSYHLLRGYLAEHVLGLPLNY